MFLVPCLNEALLIAETVSYLAEEAVAINAGVMVIDGGSTDGTLDILRSVTAGSDLVQTMDNPARIQAAAINLAVGKFQTQEYFIRVDAHGRFPSGFAKTLLSEAEEHAADSVVVAMRAVGATTFQRAAARAQNSVYGNGGAAHRRIPKGGTWVDHGHHALMSTATFTAVGGYDTTFSHNEDAELDHRIALAGGKIWLTDAVRLDYYPRSSAVGLARQYFAFGRGRCKTMAKHRIRPRARQALLLGVAPSVALALVTPVWALAGVPAVVWVASGAVFSGTAAARSGDRADVLAGPAALMMHLAWSAGFWREAVAQISSGANRTSSALRRKSRLQPQS